jgi:hypothetical protein
VTPASSISIELLRDERQGVMEPPRIYRAMMALRRW